MFSIQTCFPQLCYKNILQRYFPTSYASDSNLKQNVSFTPVLIGSLELNVVQAQLSFAWDNIIQGICIGTSFEVQVLKLGEKK